MSLSKAGTPDIYRVNLAGEVIRRLTFDRSIEISPCWSPGGLDVVFTSDRTGTPQLYIMDADGAGRRRLTFEGQYNDSAVWSPNGEQIIYACREGNYTQLGLIQTPGENRRVLTDWKWRSCEDPSWAPDGRHVVFASDRSGTFKLYVMDVVEGAFRQLTYGQEPDITPAWSP
jgi:TolB protein